MTKKRKKKRIHVRTSRGENSQMRARAAVINKVAKIEKNGKGIRKEQLRRKGKD